MDSIMIVRILVGILFGGVGVALLMKELKGKKNYTAAAMASVTDYVSQVHTDVDHGDSLIFYPVLRYYAADEWFEKTYSVGSGRKKYAVGDQVEIHYDPQNPKNFSIAGDKTNYILSIAFILFGIIIIVTGFIQ